MGRYQPFNDLPAAGHFVYVLRAANGDAVYVGKSSNVRQRIREHAGRPWFDTVTRAETIACADDAEASWRERALIWELAPLANVTGQNWPRYRQRIERLLRKGGVSEGDIARGLGVAS